MGPNTQIVWISGQENHLYIRKYGQTFIFSEINFMPMYIEDHTLVQRRQQIVLFMAHLSNLMLPTEI